MKNIMETTKNMNALVRYFICTSGAIAILFAVLAPVLVGASGMAVDYTLAYLVQQRLSAALDAAALAGAASSSDEAVIKQRVQDFFDANYPEEEFGYALEPVVTLEGDNVIVSANAYHNTTFMSMIGIEKVNITASTNVVRQVQGIEVVLVLDVTGSMSGSKIASLRKAAENFVYIMYGINTDDGAAANAEDLDSMGIRNNEFIKIGIVPYSSSVNVGPYGLGDDVDGGLYGSTFVNNPHDLSYKAGGSSSYWGGCVLAHDYPKDTEDHTGKWDMYRYCRDEDDVSQCSGVANTNCPVTPITPLVTSPSQLRESIDTLTAQGHTYGNFGMVWGWRVLSPEFPFEEAEEWDNTYWKKAVIMMTDGVNTIHSKYSAYGFTYEDGLAGSTDQNKRFLEICEKLKEKDVSVYTVTFASGGESAKSTYEECATTEDYYEHAPTDDDLVEVFEKISRQLSRLHISE